VISRTLIVVVALGAALLQASRGAWIEALGLSGLGFGRLALDLWPAKRWIAWTAFCVTAVAMVTVLVRRAQTGG
jgi:hypothetical protein